MPLDPSIILGARMPEVANPFAIAQQVQSLRIQQQQAQSLAEERQAIAEERRARTAQLQRELHEADALNQLPLDEQGNVQPGPLYKIVGPERGAKILKLQWDLRKDRYATEKDGREGALTSLAGIEALPAPLRAETWQARIAKWSKMGLDVSELPQEYSPEAAAEARNQLLTPDKRYDVEHPKPIDVAGGNSLMTPQGTVLGTAPLKPQHSAAYNEWTDANADRQARGLKPVSFEQYQNEDANRKRPVTNITAGGSGALDPEGVEYAATQYRVTGQMPALGMGNGQARAAIINAAAKQSRDLHQTPAMAIQKQAAYKSDGKSLDLIKKLAVSSEAAEQKMLGQADLVRDLSARVSRTTWPMLNRAILAGQTEIAGDKDATLLLNAITTYTSEYSKVIEGSTGSVAGSSDSARHASSKLITAAMNKGTIAGALDLMAREVALTRQGYDVTIDHITQRMGGQPQTTTEPVTTPATTAPPAAVAAVSGAPKVGERRLINGKLGEWDGHGWKAVQR